MIHSNKWLYIQSCLDCGFIPSKKSIKAWEKPHLDITEIKHEPEPIGLKSRGGFGRNYEDK